MLGSCCMNSAQLPPSQSVRCVSAVLLNSHLMSPWYLEIITCSRVRRAPAASDCRLGVVTQWRRYAVHTMTSYDTPDRFGQELVHVKLVKADPDSQLSLPSLGQHRPVLLQYCNRKQCHSQFIKPYLRQFCLFYSFLHDHQSLSFFVSR